MGHITEVMEKEAVIIQRNCLHAALN